MQEEAAEDDELFIVDENGETQLSGYLGPDFENNLRVPLLEILKYPYLLLHEKVSTYPIVYTWKGTVLFLLKEMKITTNSSLTEVSVCVYIRKIFFLLQIDINIC